MLGRIALGSLLTVAALVAVPSELRAQRDAQALTTSLSHIEARVSPNGARVVSEAGRQLLVVNADGTGERALVERSLRGDFVWAADSSGIYYVDGLSLSFVSALGGSPREVIRLSTSLQIRLGDVDRAGVLYGAHQDSSAGTPWILFSVQGNGSATSIDELRTESAAIGRVQLDPSEQFLLYQRFQPVPFTVFEIVRVDAATGMNELVLGGGPIGTNVSSSAWLDNGSTAMVSGVVRSVGPRVGVYRYTAAGDVQLLTDPAVEHAIAEPAAEADWIVVQPFDDGFGGNGPAIMPKQGGGLVYLDQPGRRYISRGRPDIDAGATQVAFAGELPMDLSRVYGLEIEDEMRVFPRAEVGNPVTFELTLGSGSSFATMFVSVFKGAAPVVIPGVLEEFCLGNLLVSAGSVVGPGTVSTTTTIPNNPSLVGLTIWFQGIRFGGAGATWTRHGSLTIF